MRRYILKRLLLAIPTVWGVTLVVFLMLQSIPGDPIQIWMGMNYDPVAAEAIRKELGMDQALHIQYLKWLWQVIQGNFGRSIQTNVPVLKDILQRLPVTLELTFFSMIIVVGIAVFLGTASARKQFTWVDYTSMVTALTGISIPEFFTGILLIILCGVYLHILPTSGFVPISQGLAKNLSHMVLPAIALGFSRAAAATRMVRSAMLEVLRNDYIETARSKGVSEGMIVYKHALRNALIPSITVMGVTLGYMLGGAIVVEKVFALPGVGSFVIDAILQGDYPKVQGMILVSGLIFVLLNLTVDIIYGLVDPRIRYGNGSQSR
jgi:peptide/nickel transport system permease protein